MSNTYTFGLSGNPLKYIQKLRLKILKKNTYFFKKNNFFFFSKKNTKRYSENNIYIFVIGKIFNKKEIVENYNKDINKNFLINLYKKFGYEKLLSFIDGDVQILIYDSEKEKIFFNNSKFGVMPCYFYEDNNEILFSNNLKELAHIKDSYELNNKYIKRFLGFHYRQIENKTDTPFRKIKKLQPSFYIDYNIGKNQNLLIKKRWYLISNKNNDYNNWNENDLCKKLIDLISKSIKKRVPNKNFFCSLSGGLDSSTLAALINNNNNNKVDAATISYQDQTYDEVNDTKKFAKKFVNDWNIVKLSQDIQTKIEKSCSIADKPLITSTWFSDYFLKEHMGKRGYKFAVSGLGGDQLHAGEYDYFHFYFADLKKKNSKFLKKEIEGWIKHHNHKIFKKNYLKEVKFLNKLMKSDKVNYGIDHDRNKKYTSFLNPKYNRSYKVYSENPYNTHLLNKSFNEIYYEMLPCCLPHDFDNSNNFNIQNLYPYLDSDLFEFMFSLRNSLKIKNGVQKILLRMATKNIITSDTNKRIKKTGWNSPAHIWFAEEKNNILEDTLHSNQNYISEFINLKKVKNLIDEHKKIIKNKINKENHMMFLWQILSMELWLKSLKIK